MAQRNSGILGFIKAFSAHWFEAMSGSASVPAAVAAEFVTNTTEKALLAALSIVCIILASYLIWKKERERNNLLAAEYENLSERSKPKLSIHFDEDDEFISSYHPDRKPWLMIPVAIKNDGGIFLDDCRVRVRYDPPGYPRRSDGVSFGNQLSCRPFSLLPDDGTLIEIFAFDDPKFQPCETFLRIITFTEETEGWTEQGSGTQILLPGKHQITVEVFSANTRRSSIDLILSYQGDVWIAKNAI